MKKTGKKQKNWIVLSLIQIVLLLAIIAPAMSAGNQTSNGIIIFYGSPTISIPLAIQKEIDN